MTKLAEIKPATFNDIPRMLRELADRIESGEQPAHNVMLVVQARDGSGTSTNLYGWGPQAFGFYAAGMLHAGLRHLLKETGE